MRLFLLGVAVGAAGVYLAERSPLWRPGGQAAAGTPEAPAGSEAPAPASRQAGHRDGSVSRRRHGADAGAGAATGAHRTAAGPLVAGAAAAATAGTPGAAAQPAAGMALPEGPARVALVIDDLGRSLQELDALHRLGVAITYAVLPFESQTSEVVAALRRRHDEILCHLPMEPTSGGNPGPGALRAGMSQEELRQSTQAAIDAVPGAVGVNNHMGSGLSADAGSMATILGVLAARGLYFLDSRTSARSVGFRVATALGVPAAERQVFLDDDPRPEAVAAQFDRLLELARARGGAIAIGHPHPQTLATLAAEVPRARALGYRFVQVSALLDHPPDAPR